jgi:DNA modification methylase
MLLQMIQKQENNMKIMKIPIEQIRFAPYNPRMIKDSEFDKLKHSITTFDYVEPIVWNSKTGHAVGGNQRLKALVELGFKEAEIVVVDLSLEKEKMLNLALNRISGAWDEDKLAAILDELTQIPEFDITQTGFDLPEVSELLDLNSDPKEDNFNINEMLEQIDEPITKPGDLISLGKHMLLCGDSSKPDDIAKLMGDKKVNMIFCDPPYSVAYYGGNRPLPEKARPKACRNWKRIYNDNLSQEDYEKWLKQIFVNVDSYIAPGAPVYVWNGHRQFGPMHSMLIGLGFHISCVITWAKENFAIGYGDYNQQTEFCLYGWKEDNGAHLWYGPTNESTLWQIKRDPTSKYLHPTQKCVALAHRAIKNSSKREDIVLDMFLGSGTTLLASEGLGRVCYGIEVEPAYCDVIVKRYINYIGKQSIPDDIKKYVS